MEGEGDVGHLLLLSTKVCIVIDGERLVHIRTNTNPQTVTVNKELVGM